MSPSTCRVLFCYHTDPAKMPPARFDDAQILCGPFVEDRQEAGRVVSLRTPVGEYDIRHVVDRLGAEQRPDIVLVKTDATGANLPRRLGDLGVPALLIVGDTHHLVRPLRAMLRYAAMEPFVATVLDHNRQHLHWFAEAGCPRVTWLPGAFWHDHPTPFLRRRERRACLVGHHRRYHVERQRVIDALRASGHPVLIGLAPPEQAALYYATSLVSVNCSLNGDLNLRVFEAMAAGGCLLTDRLSPQSGLELLFRSGTDLVIYSGTDDLIGIIERMLADPPAAVSIAAAGRAQVQRNHGLAARWQVLDGLATGASIDPRLMAAAEPRTLHVRSPDETDRLRRIAQYEYIQERHRAEPALSAVGLKSADPRTLCDLADLTRLRLSRISRDGDPLLAAAGVIDQIGTVDAAAAHRSNWDIAILGQDDIMDTAWLAACRPHTILVTGSSPANAGLTSAGYRPLGADYPGVYQCDPRRSAP